MRYCSFDELNALAAAVAAVGQTEAPEERKRQAEDNLLGILVRAYQDGHADAQSELGEEETDPDIEDMNEVIYHMIAGEIFTDRIDDHIDAGDDGRLQDLVISEYHRVYNAAVQHEADRAAQASPAYGSAAEGSLRGSADSILGATTSPVVTGIEKRWVTMKDNRVRDTHRYLEGMTVPYDAQFFTFDGDKALYPGGFSDPANNVNCRCHIELRKLY